MKPPRIPAAPAWGRGFSLLELVLVVSLVAIFIVVAIDRSLRYLEAAEKAAMETTVGALRSALTLRVGALYTVGGGAALTKLNEENPFTWLSQRPDAYIGPQWDPKLADVGPGSWYFDRSTRQVVYRPQRTRYLVRPGPDDPRIRFKVAVEYSPANIVSPSNPTLLKADLEAVSPYLWQAGEGPEVR